MNNQYDQDRKVKKANRKRKIYRAVDKTGTFIKKHWWKGLFVFLLLRPKNTDDDNNTQV